MVNIGMTQNSGTGKAGGENKENVICKTSESSDSDERTTEDGDDGSGSTASEQSEDSILNIQTRSGSRSSTKKDEDSRHLDIGEHYMVRRVDGQWCKSPCFLTTSDGFVLKRC